METLYELTVHKDEDIREAIGRYVLLRGWQEALIIGAIGSVTDTAYNAPRDGGLPIQTETTLCPGPAEILSFTGEVMRRERVDPALLQIYRGREEPLFIHIHASCAQAGGRVVGGGLVKGRVFRSLRVILSPVGELIKEE